MFKYIIVVGNLSHVVGPFDSRLSADIYAGQLGANPRWFGYTVQVVRIYEPARPGAEPSR